MRDRAKANLLQDAPKESAICRDCKTRELQLLKNKSKFKEQSGKDLGSLV